MNGGDSGYSFNNGSAAPNRGDGSSGGGRWGMGGGGGLGSFTANGYIDIADPTWRVSAFASAAAPHMQQQPPHTHNNPFMNFYYGQQMQIMTQPPAVGWPRGGGGAVPNSSFQPILSTGGGKWGGWCRLICCIHLFLTIFMADICGLFCLLLPIRINT